MTRPAGTFGSSSARVGDSPCPGGCNRDWRKAEAARVAELERVAAYNAVAATLKPKPIHPDPKLIAHGVKPRPGQPIWCHGCSTRIAEALADLPELYVRLEMDRVHGTRGPAEHVSGSPVPGSPSPLGDAQDELVRWLCAWEDSIREARGFSTRPARLGVAAVVVPVGPLRPGEARVRELSPAEARTLLGAHEFVTRHLGWALEDDELAVDLGQQALSMHRRLRNLTLSGEQRTRMKAPCPRCGLRMLVHEDGSRYVGCENPGCGRLLLLDEYDELARAVARSEATA